MSPDLYSLLKDFGLPGLALMLIIVEIRDLAAVNRALCELVRRSLGIPPPDPPPKRAGIFRRRIE